MDSTATAPSRAPTLPKVTRTAKILIVDNNDDEAELVRLLLVFAGHEIRVALNSSDALSIAEIFRPAIAVIHLGMPVTNGYELAQQLHARHPALHLIELTSWNDTETRRLAHSAGFKTLLIKPQIPQDFVRVINEAAA